MAGGDIMLKQTLDAYLAVRHASGFELRVPAILLRSFVRFAQDRGHSHVTTQTAFDWAAIAPSKAQRHYRLKAVIRFAKYARADDARNEVPPKGIFGHNRRRPVPFIFTSAGIGRLLKAASRLGPAGSLRPHMYRTLFALLACTGLRISEALALQFDDITSDGLLIRKTKFHKERLVPLHETAVDGLEDYLIRRRRVGGADNHVFISLRGQGVRYYTVYETFRSLVQTLGLEPETARPRPKLHSLRHTFAVRVLEACPQGRDRINRHMLALSTYLGHARITDTYWYLEATPQLMTDIADTCERFTKGDKP
jgi:integrase